MRVENSLDGVLKCLTKVDYTFKLLMLGSASTGKTTLSDRYITGLFNPDIKLTVGVEFYVKTVQVYDASGTLKNVKLQIWDLGGENRFRFLLPTYCLGSSGALFLYDITRVETIHAITEWTGIVKEKNKGIPIILVGNKLDLEEHRKIPKEHGDQTAKQNEMVEFIEVSAKSGVNVEDVFNKITHLMMDNATDRH